MTGHISRRQFLKRTAGYRLALASGSFISCAATTGQPLKRSSVLNGIQIIDAHASSATLRDIVEISTAPIMDLHTNPFPFTQGRLRGVEDIAKIVETGGIVCTWPLRYRGRETLEDWANEIISLKNVFGINHVGLGTDGGGGLPKKIKGYRDIRDLTKLADTMTSLGLSRSDIAAYMGANFARVFTKCAG